MILNTFTYFWCILKLYIGKYILNINNEHAQDYSYPGTTFAFCSHWEKLPRQGGLPGVVQRVPASRWCPGAMKNTCEQLQASDHAPRQSWPQGQWVVPGSCEQALRKLSAAQIWIQPLFFVSQRAMNTHMTWFVSGWTNLSRKDHSIPGDPKSTQG